MLSPPPFITAATPITDSLLALLARLPTPGLPAVIDDGFYAQLDDRSLMRLAVLLALKSRDEGGCPIGAVIVDSATGRILGKGHNTLVQDGDPYNHGETAAIRDAGRIDFSTTTLFTSLSPCRICACLIIERGFARVVVGDVTNAAGHLDALRRAGVAVEVLEDAEGVTLYRRYREAEPRLDLEDWRGKAALQNT